MKKLLLLVIGLCLIYSATALEGRLPLLAVRETPEGQEGSTAELFLEIKEGSGRVFVDTFPLSKVDTQISMRIAKEIACDLLSYDCDDLDFIYTLRASTPIIGGPSAGAAAASLTIAVLSESPIEENISITGTINSGGLVGPVGGLKEKIEAGASINLKKILVPLGENVSVLLNNKTNRTVGLVEYGESLGVEIVEVADVFEALDTLTSKDFRGEEEDIVLSDNYVETMKKLATQLCERNNKLESNVQVENESEAVYSLAANLSERGKVAYGERDFYSAASYCFGSNVRFNQAFLNVKNFSDVKYEGLMEDLREEILEFENEIDGLEIKTITDLESFMIVKERLADARRITNDTNNLAYSYAYANERLRSAYSWAQFFQNTGKELDFDDESLRDSCRQRIAEAEERIQYLSIYTPLNLRGPQEELDGAYEDGRNENYALCLFKASKAKAEASIVLNTLGVDNSFIPVLIDNKLQAASRVINNAEKKEVFPVLGYSYYEYAQNLKETDRFSALLYAEYALELSNLDVYFKEKEKEAVLPNFDGSEWGLILTGVAVGLIIGMVLNFGKKEDKEPVVTKKQRTVKKTKKKVSKRKKPSKTRSSAGKKR